MLIIIYFIHGITALAVPACWALASLPALGALRKLTSLKLWGAKVSDNGLKSLAVHQSLQTLDLGCTNITERGLKQI